MPKTAFHDIVYDNSTVSTPGNTLPGPSIGPSPLYSPLQPPEVGFDLATGLGSPVANVLVPDLVAPTEYWAGTSGGTWNSALADWRLGGPSGALEPWVYGGNAVFPGSGTVNLATGFSPIPNSVTFLGNTTLTGGTLSLPSGSSISVSTGVTGTIDSAVACSSLTVSILAATLQLEGNVSAVGNISVVDASGGSLWFYSPYSPGNVDTIDCLIAFAKNLVNPATLGFEDGLFYYDPSLSGYGITGDVQVEEAGSSTLSLGGTNTYTDGTWIQSGRFDPLYETSMPSGGTLKVGLNASVLGTAPASGTVWDPNSVQALQPSGTYGVGSEIDIAVPLSSVVNVSGSPELALALGSTTRYAQYVSGSGTSTLWFSFIVQPGDSSPALDYTGTNAILLNGGTILDSSGNPITPVLPAPGTTESLAWYEGLAIDTTAPVVSSIDCMGSATTNANQVQFAVTFSKPVYNVSPADFVLAGSGVTGTIASVAGGGTSYLVTVSGLSGTGTLGLNLDVYFVNS